MPVRAKKQKAEINKMFFFKLSPNMGIKFDLYIDDAGSQIVASGSFKAEDK
jgi:hypothetical protein